ncbi:hypothetical protein [Polaromonas naphthalenivorans]|nr:hypothetical protein [Polaromonas naphthalenivorans]
MSKRNFEAVQKVLNLDVPYPNFPAWDEKLEFIVEGVAVKATVSHAWRNLTISIISPFELLAWTFEPPLIALGPAMLSRQASLEKRGITDAEDCLIRAKKAYLTHVAYLRLKPQIDAVQAEFIKKFAGKLESRLLVSDSVRARITLEKSALRSKFKSGEIGQKEYQTVLKRLGAQACEASHSYSNLKYKVKRGLEEIKNSMMDKALADQLIRC